MSAFPANSRPARTLGILLALALGLAAAASTGHGSQTREPPNSSIRRVLSEGKYPWYDANSGRVVPMLPPVDTRGGWLERVANWISDVFRPIREWLRGFGGLGLPGLAGAGDAVAVGLVLLVLLLVIAALVELLRRYRRTIDLATDAVDSAARRAQRIEGLPLGARIDAADPWAEARRLRAQGDLRGAIIHLFAHQLLMLDRARQVRLGPGRTGRQLVRSVADRSLRASVEPTLRLFEAVYYGHQSPTPEAFEAVWSLVPGFVQRVAALSAGAAS